MTNKKTSSEEILCYAGEEVRIYFVEIDSDKNVERFGVITSLSENGNGKGIFGSWMTMQLEDSFNFGKMFLDKCIFCGTDFEMLATAKEELDRTERECKRVSN